jgi:hypothetical protein
MNEENRDALEMRSRALFQDSVDNLDFATRSRLTQARNAALEAAQGHRPWYLRWTMWTPAAGVTAAAVLGVALWLGSPSGQQVGILAEGQANFEDLELVAASEGSGDVMEMLQDDIDFYDFADKASSPDPAA